MPGSLLLRPNAVTSLVIRGSVAQQSRPQMPRYARRLYSSLNQTTGNSATTSRFTYRLAAASAAKRTPPRPSKQNRDFFCYTSTHIPPSSPYLRSSKSDSGEDAFFATAIGGSANHVAFGVADGVGGWQDSGVDPSEFSHGLCGLMAGTACLHEGPASTLKPKHLLQTAYDAVIANPRILAGGCTASLAIADAEGSLESANLGDSGYLLLSPGKVSYRSTIQTHAFNTPFQLSKVPAKMQAQHAIFGGSTHFSETPAQADVTTHALRHGDIVLFATDGVWDNLSAQDTLAIVTRVMEEGGYWFKSHNFPGSETLLNAQLIREVPERVETATAATYLPGLLATAVMREAKAAGLDRRRDGPFAREVKMYYPQEGWEGGKPDDIAVVVCVAVENEVTENTKPLKAKL